MRSRVSITVELYDEPTAIANGGQTVRWNRTLLDDDPKSTGPLLAEQLRFAQHDLPAIIARLRGGEIPS